MPPPEGFRIEIARIENRFWMLKELLPEGLDPKEAPRGDSFEEEWNVQTSLPADGVPRDVTLDGEVFERFAEHARRIVFKTGRIDDKEKETLAEGPLADQPESIRRSGGVISSAAMALEDLLRDYYGRKLDLKTRVELAWRVAAGFDQIKHGIKLERSLKAVPPDWAILRIEDSKFGRVFNGENGPVQTLQLSFRILNGVFAGLSFTQSIPYRYVMFKLAREIGFPSFTHLDKNDIVLAYFAGLLDPAGKYGPTVTEFFASEPLKTRNRRLFKKRSEPCHAKFNWPCVKCTLGHKYAGMEIEEDNVQKQCFRATHSNTYIKRVCASCSTDSWFEPDSVSNVCLSCENEKAMKRLRIAARR